MGKQNHLQAKKVYSFISSDHFPLISLLIQKNLTVQE